MLIPKNRGTWLPMNIETTRMAKELSAIRRETAPRAGSDRLLVLA
jgi:hypothetical protein